MAAAGHNRYLSVMEDLLSLRVSIASSQINKYGLYFLSRNAELVVIGY